MRIPYDRLKAPFTILIHVLKRIGLAIPTPSLLDEVIAIGIMERLCFPTLETR